MRDRLFCFYDWCAQHDDIPELVTLAATMPDDQAPLGPGLPGITRDGGERFITSVRRPGRRRTGPAGWALEFYDRWLPGTMRRITDITRQCMPQCVMLRGPGDWAARPGYR